MVICITRRLRDRGEAEPAKQALTTVLVSGPLGPNLTVFAPAQTI
jgi:hypothetical protein